MPRPFPASLPAITALARSGAVERAWEAFAAGGWAAREDDAGALAVKGRLLKDKALGAGSGADRAMLLAAAEAYGAAHALAPAPYLLINVATLHALAGDGERAARIAGEVLPLLEGDVAETRYYIAATRAEAHLLRGEQAQAEAALAAAARADPDGWLDRASTIRQLERICTASGSDSAWLDPYRPPRSLHFVGHMGLAQGEAGEAQLAGATDALIARERIGFGYGALAAGSDIVIAERIVASGAALHVVLPLPVEDFVAQSVRAEGADWLMRFERLMAAAETIQSVTRIPGAFEPLATALGGTVAMGRARLNAHVLASEAVQLAVLDETGGGANTVLQTENWRGTGSRAVFLNVARDDHCFRRAETAHSPAGRCLGALLHIALPDDEADMPARLGQLAALANHPRLFAMSERRGWLLGVETVADVLAFASELASGNFTLTAHYGLIERADDPLTAGQRAWGNDVAICQILSSETAPGAFIASESFAAALALEPRTDWRAEPLGLSDSVAIQRFALFD